MAEVCLGYRIQEYQDKIWVEQLIECVGWMKVSQYFRNLEAAREFIENRHSGKV